MEGTGDLGNHIAGIVTRETYHIFEHPAALDTRVDVLDAHSSARQFAICGLLFVRQCSTARFLLWCGTHHTRQYEGEKAEILKQFTPFGERVRCCISNSLVVSTSFIRVREKQNEERRIDQQYVLYGVTLFLAAIAAFLFICIFGTLDPSFGSVMAKRGASVD